MDDLSEQLSALLSDPNGMERIKDMAQSLLGGQKTEQTDQIQKDEEINIGALTQMMKLMKKSGNDDSRIKLLLALKPNLSPERQERVDSAIRILKLIELAPMLKDLGLFNF